jgi:hypothetical protein
MPLLLHSCGAETTASLQVILRANVGAQRLISRDRSHNYELHPFLGGWTGETQSCYGLRKLRVRVAERLCFRSLPYIHPAALHLSGSCASAPHLRLPASFHLLRRSKHLRPDCCSSTHSPSFSQIQFHIHIWICADCELHHAIEYSAR